MKSVRFGIYKTNGFTLIELLISISLLLTILTIGINTFGYFSAEAKLSESRNYLDNLLITVNTNSLTGKSNGADFYRGNNSKLYQVSKYFLLFKVSDNWYDENKVIYGELQTGISDIITLKNGLKEIIFNKIDGKNIYKISYTKIYEIPEPVYISNINFQTNGSYTGNISVGNVRDIKSGSLIIMFFTPPFGKVSFLEVKDLDVLEKNGNDFWFYKSIYEISDGDRAHELYLDLTGYIEQRGEIEFALQYKDRKYDGSGTGNNYWLKEYVKYNSRNELSHYWD